MKNLLFYLLLTTVGIVSPAMGAGKKKANVKNEAISLKAELDELHRIDRLPYYRSGIVEQISSYDTTGLNDDGFSGKYSFIRKEGKNLVLADLKGPGVINRIWTPTPTTDTIQFYFDGEKTPRISIPFIDLFSGKVFPFLNPVCGNEVGGYYCYIPIQYKKSCKIVYLGENIQFHQIQYRPYPAKAQVHTFSMDWTAEERAALDASCRLWNMETNPVARLREAGNEIKEETKQFFLSPGEQIPIFTSRDGGRIVGIEVECGTALEGPEKDIILQAMWDDDDEPAIYSPAADFFGYAYGQPAMRSVLAGNGNGVNYCYLPMPFERKAELKMVYEKRNTHQPKVELKTKVYYTSAPRDSEKEGRLYTIWRREINPEDYKPYLFADIRDKGHYVGTIHQAQGLRPGMTLFFEGDDSTCVDGVMRMHGTGSEDYYNGGWYALLDRWDRGVSLPIHGSLDYSLPMGRTGGYRFFTTDKLSFERTFLHTMEHGPEHNLFPVDYTSVAFYYGTKPSGIQVRPTEALRTVYYPSSHVFFPQLMDLSLGWDTQVENRGRLIASTSGEGIVRIMLNDIPEGNYKISLSYFQTSDGGEFSIWNRQKMIKDWANANAPEEKRLEKQALGTIQVTRQTNSISIRIKKTEKGNKFHFENLYLEKQETD